MDALQVVSRARLDWLALVAVAGALVTRPPREPVPVPFPIAPGGCFPYDPPRRIDAVVVSDAQHLAICRDPSNATFLVVYPIEGGGPIRITETCEEASHLYAGLPYTNAP
jgi:hypothetical protein